MHQELIKQLKKLRTIEPDPGFVSRSRVSFVTEAPVAAGIPVRWSVSWGSRLVGAFTVLAVAIGTISYLFPARPVLSSSLDPESLNNELQKTIGIQVQELSFNEGSAQTINSALQEITDTKTRHLNQTVLSSEASSTGFSVSVPDNSSAIDDLLNQVTN